MAESLTIPGVKGAFAIGLTWQHEEIPPKRPALRANAISMGRNVRWAVVHTSAGGAVQSGYCEPISGVKPGKVKPLAAYVADRHPQPWRGIYQLDEDRYWYIAVRQGHAIIAGSDCVGSLSELAAVRAHHDGLGDWTEVDGSFDNLVQMARGAKRAVAALQDVHAGPWRTTAVASAVLGMLGVVAAGGWYWYDQQQEAERAEIARKQAAFAAQQAKSAAAQFVYPWARDAMPSAFASACADAWEGQELGVKGWPLASWECKPSPTGVAVGVGWKRDGGLAVDAPGFLGGDGSSSSRSLDVPVRFRGSSQQAENQAGAQRAMWSLAQAFGLDLQLTLQAAPIQKDTSVPPDPWVKYSAVLTLYAPPWTAPAGRLDDVPGLRINEISFDANTQKWKAIGTLYAMRAGAVRAVANRIDSGGQP